MCGGMWSRSAFLVVVALGWFPTGVVGGTVCTNSTWNVKLENAGACAACEASCSGADYCVWGCGYFFGDYLTSCKTRCISLTPYIPEDRGEQCKEGCEYAAASPEGKAMVAYATSPEGVAAAAWGTGIVVALIVFTLFAMMFGEYLRFLR